MRVTDDLVRAWLQWARNFEEIESWEQIAARGRKWLVKVPPGIRKGRQDLPLHLWFDREGVVPTELVLSSREALLFALGCAVGGARERATWTQEDWEARAERRRRHERQDVDQVVSR
jgi:hypothetical protein